MKILVTGAAGFIGSFLCRRLIDRGDEVIGIDNINDYYSVALKYARLKNLGIDDVSTGLVTSNISPNFKFAKLALEDEAGLDKLCKDEHFDVICNLAAQAGVRYSLKNPRAYISSNIDGFINILEACRCYNVKHLVFASSSSVYGLNGKVPFSEHDGIAHPVSLYAATKKSNELMAHAYSHLYGIPSTGLRFFTVYGPWGRPDMSPFIFASAIFNNRPIKVFNNGKMLRDFTYIDDIVEGVVRVIDKVPVPDTNWVDSKPDPASSSAPYRIYNIGNSKPIKLMDFIMEIERACGHEAVKEFLPMQPGDVYQTFADTDLLQSDFGYSPSTSLRVGVERTIEWFKNNKILTI